jgi:hypothetical protein
MTKDEAERIDRLTADIGDWRVKMKDDIAEAVRTHQASCLELHLTPIKTDLEWLVDNAKTSIHEDQLRRRQRKRYLTLFGVLIPVCAITVPLLVHWGVI